jgi:hypothetical protein
LEDSRTKCILRHRVHPGHHRRPSTLGCGGVSASHGTLLCCLAGMISLVVETSAGEEANRVAGIQTCRSLLCQWQTTQHIAEGSTQRTQMTLQSSSRLLCLRKPGTGTRSPRCLSTPLHWILWVFSLNVMNVSISPVYKVGKRTGNDELGSTLG